MLYARTVPVASELLSSEIAASLEVHGTPTDVHIEVLGCDELREALGPEFHGTPVNHHAEIASVIKGIRSHRLCAVILEGKDTEACLKTITAEGLAVAVIVCQRGATTQASTELRALGAMEVAADLDREHLLPLVKRAIDYRALVLLELAHRCESKRLMNRELELLGQPPEGMSDDLSTAQPPPLPVGPMSVFNLEEASESFEKAYIDRVLQLSGSAREAALFLGVSAATLSRRTKKGEGGDEP